MQPVLMLALALLALTISDASAQETPWQEGDNTRARLIGGGKPADAPAGSVAIGLEITLAATWKTYWRNPGSSGVPPRIDWKGSSNIAALEVRFPAPLRIADPDGDIYGYKDHVIIPMIVKPQDAAKPVTLALGVEYGVCKDICIPIEMRFTAAIPPDAGNGSLAASLSAALAKVPRVGDALRPSDPRLESVKIDLASPKPGIIIVTRHPGGPAGAELFLEAPDGLWIPLARRQGADGDRVTFTVDLSDGADVADLRGKSIRATIVSAVGETEASFPIE